MSNEIRIPTLLGLGVLFAGLFLGVFVVLQGQTSFFTKAAPNIIPQEILVANISHSSATIIWKTEEPTSGFIKLGTSPSLTQTFSDARDTSGPLPHFLHFINLKELSPSTLFHYKISSGPLIHPASETLTFTTSKELPYFSYKPLIGHVLDVTGQEIDEAIVLLEVAGAQRLAAITKEGRFILPLAEIKTEDLSKPFLLDNTTANLKVITQSGITNVSLTLPVKDSILPPITVGKEVTITPKVSSPSATATPSATPTPKVPNFDINKDKKVNSLDYSIVLDNLGSKPKNIDADLNFDGVVDKKDLDLMNKYISGNSTR